MFAGQRLLSEAQYAKWAEEIGLDLDHFLVGLHAVAFRDIELHHGGFGDGLTELRHEDGNFRHG